MGIDRRVMVVAGGEWQVPLVKLAKAEGHFVVNTNLYPDSPAFRHADVGIVADVLDKERNLDIAREYRPDAVVTDQSDIAVPTVAYLCEELGLPGIGVEAARRFTNKFEMRSFCRRMGFETPPFMLCHSVAEAVRFGRECGYPVVVKPPASQSSRGVSVAKDAEAVKASLTAAAEFSPDGSVLVEGFLPGTELTVEGIKFADRHLTLAISRKRHMKGNPMVANRLLYTGTCEDIEYGNLRVMNDAMVSAMGLPFGLTHAEYKHNARKFTLVEIAARGGGTRISSDIVPALTGVPTNKHLIDMALGRQVRPSSCGSSARAAVLEFFEFAPGRVAGIDGVANAQSVPGIVDLGFTIRPGDCVAEARDDRSRHGYVIAVGESEESVLDAVSAVKACVKVRYV